MACAPTAATGCIRASIGPPEAGRPDPTGAFAIAKLLIAEDDRLVSLVMIELLSRAGHELAHAIDGVEALALLRGSRPPFDLALVDLVMPELDGAQLLAACRDEFPAMPVVVTSGYAEPVVMASLGDHRPDGFLAKPWPADALLDMVERLLQRRW